MATRGPLDNVGAYANATRKRVPGFLHFGRNDNFQTVATANGALRTTFNDFAFALGYNSLDLTLFLIYVKNLLQIVNVFYI